MLRAQPLLPSISTESTDRLMSLSLTSPIFASHSLLGFVICMSHSATYPWLGFLGESRQRHIFLSVNIILTITQQVHMGTRLSLLRKESNLLKLH